MDIITCYNIYTRLVETMVQYRIKLLEQPIAFMWGSSHSSLPYSLTSSLLANKVVTTEVGPDETFTDLEARVSKEHNIPGKLTWHSPGEARDVNRLSGSQRVTTVFPDPTLFHIGVIAEEKPAEEETVASAESRDFCIQENVAQDSAVQENVDSYPESPTKRVVARIIGNKTLGNSTHINRIKGPMRASSEI